MDGLRSSYGNGFLDRLEHRQQYKLNGERLFQLGEHRPLFWNWLLRSSYVPGLVPIFAENQYDSNFPNYGDTIDPAAERPDPYALIA